MSKIKILTPGVQKTSRGFTLIELLVVIAVLGVLSAIVLVAINPGKRMAAARDTERQAGLAQMRNALDAYYATNGRYPSTQSLGVWDGWRGECNHPWGPKNLPRTGPNGYIPGLAPEWLKILPSDPRLNNGLCGTGSCYLYATNGYDYKLLAHCLPENYPGPSQNRFYDPTRPTWSWAVWSSNVSKGW